MFGIELIPGIGKYDIKIRPFGQSEFKNNAKK